MEVHFTPETEKKLKELSAKSGRDTADLVEDALASYAVHGPATSVDWSQCSAVESVPGKRSGAWVFKGTRTPVSVIFENLPDMSIVELVEEFGVTREQVQAVLEFVARSTEPASAPRS